MTQAYIHIPTAWTFAAIKAGASLDQLNAYFASVGAPAVAVGDPNPFWQYVLELGVTGSIVRGNSGAELASFGPIERTAFLDFDPIGLTLLVGGEVDGLPVWLEVSEANYQGAVPATLPGATYTDAEGVEQTHTWETWQDGSHPRQGPWDGKYYVPGNSMGSELAASVWWPIYNTPPAGVAVLSVGEFQAIQAANQPAEV